MKKFLALLAALLLSACVVMPPAIPPLQGTEDELFWRVADALARDMPVPGYLEVGIVDLPPGYAGLTTTSPLGPILVMVDRYQDLPGMLDALTHEWAHAALVGAATEEEHDALWGVAYARAYRIKIAVFDEMKGEGPPAEASGEPSGTLQGEEGP